MVHIKFDPNEVRLDDYFQTGLGLGHFEGLSLYQRGYGYFSGFPRQRGAGIGDIFRRFWRVLKPIATSLAPVVKSAGKTIGQEGLAATARILSDVVQGGNLKESVLSEGREGVRNLLGKAEQKLSQTGRGKNKRKRNSVRTVSLKPNDFIGRTVSRSALKNKKPRFDILGKY